MSKLGKIGIAEAFVIGATAVCLTTAAFNHTPLGNAIKSGFTKTVKGELGLMKENTKPIKNAFDTFKNMGSPKRPGVKTTHSGIKYTL